MNDAVDLWLDQWERWLNLWLECGGSTPSPQAIQCLRDWATSCETAGWAEAGVQAEVLLANDSTATAKADALLDLMTWQQAARRIHQAQRL